MRSHSDYGSRADRCIGVAGRVARCPQSPARADRAHGSVFGGHRRGCHTRRHAGYPQRPRLDFGNPRAESRTGRTGAVRRTKRAPCYLKSRSAARPGRGLHRTHEPPLACRRTARRRLVTALPNLNGWLRHLLLTIALNFASPQAIVYGYLVPVLFLLGVRQRVPDRFSAVAGTYGPNSDHYHPWWSMLWTTHLAGL